GERLGPRAASGHLGDPPRRALARAATLWRRAPRRGARVRAAVSTAQRTGGRQGRGGHGLLSLRAALVAERGRRGAGRVRLDGGRLSRAQRLALPPRAARLEHDL